jgi:CBS domain-containing membrane protein
MSTDVVSVQPDTPLAQAWERLRRHHIHALPVLDAHARLVGIVSQSDLLRASGLDDYGSLGQRMRAWLRAGRTVADVMSRPVRSARTDMPIVELVPLMANAGFHHIPVLDQEGRFAGMVTQSDVVAALYESRLGSTAAA